MWYRVRRFAASLNWLLLACLLTLMAAGWALVLSATLPSGQDGPWPVPAFALRQAVWATLGLGALVAGAMVDYHVLLRLGPWIYGVGVMLLTLVLAVGHTSFGARRWFAMRGVFMQPGEFTKVGVLLVLVRLAAGGGRDPNPLRPRFIPRWLPVSLIALALPVALILGQPNLGTALLLVLSALAVWLVAGLPWSLIAGSIAAAAGTAPVVWSFLKDYQRARILNFLNPYRDPLGGGYTVIQAVTAIGSGGLTGRGFMEGPQNRLRFIPKHHTDFIVSVLGEELGWVGCLTLVFVYLLLYLEGLRIAHRARDYVGMLLAVGIVSLLASQTIINLGMNVGVVPVTGLPLPLFSYGGSSMLMACWLLGILLNVGRQRRR
ncbi:MAG: rod shape-determining protein RodA [Candidatus Coatesbacteria bacterium]